MTATRQKPAPVAASVAAVSAAAAAAAAASSVRLACPSEGAIERPVWCWSAVSSLHLSFRRPHPATTCCAYFRWLMKRTSGYREICPQGGGGRNERCAVRRGQPLLEDSVLVDATAGSFFTGDGPKPLAGCSCWRVTGSCFSAKQTFTGSCKETSVRSFP